MLVSDFTLLKKYCNKKKIKLFEVYIDYPLVFWIVSYLYIILFDEIQRVTKRTTILLLIFSFSLSLIFSWKEIVTKILAYILRHILLNLLSTSAYFIFYNYFKFFIFINYKKIIGKMLNIKRKKKTIGAHLKISIYFVEYY